MNCDPEIEKDQAKLSAAKDKCVAVIHSSMTFPDRRVQIDAFNTLSTIHCAIWSPTSSSWPKG
jgi:hypothetical protein